MAKQTTKAEPSSPANNNLFQEEYLRWVFVMIATIITYSAIAWFVYIFYVPDIEALRIEAAKLTFAVGTPEPVESLLYQLALFFIPINILFFYWISKTNKMETFFQNVKFDSFIGIFCALGIAFLMYSAFITANPSHATPANSHDFVAVTNWDFYFYQLFLHRFFPVYLLVVFPLFLALFFVLFDRFNWDTNKQIQNALSIATWCLLGLLLIVIIPLNSFEFPYTWENKYDFNAVYYSMAQVYGGSPMLVNGLSNTYGLYAQLLNPVFQITGLTPLSFSTVMAILLGLCFVFQTYFVQKFTDNKLLSLLACLSLVFFPYLVSRLLTPFDPYFAIFPIRWLPVSTLMMVAAFYIPHKKKIWYVAGNIFLSILVLWNPEIGMVCFITWLALLAYTNLYMPDKKIAYVHIAKLIVGSLFIFTAVFVVYTVMIKLFYGVFPDFMSMFKMIIVFGSFGMGMLPMSVPHPWMLLAIIYITGFVYSLSSLFDKTITEKSSAVFVLSILGSGTFMYFVGRSHNWNLLPFSGPAFMLLAILGSDLWASTKTSRLFSYKIIFAVVIFVLTVACVEMLFNAKDIGALTDNHQAKLQQAAEEESIKSNQQFIAANTLSHEKIFVFTSDRYQGLYFPPNKNRSAVNPGFIELALHTELSAYLNVIRDSSFKVFIEPAFFDIILRHLIVASVAAGYEFEKHNGSMVLLKKRASRDFYHGVLKNNHAIVYEFFSDDPSGFYKRVRYAHGNPAILLNGKTITAELVFRPTPQPYHNAVLLGNQNNDTGFIILCTDQQATYGIVVADILISFTVNLNQLNYLAVSIQEQTIAIFLNGFLIGNLLLEKPYKPSDRMLHIGNYGDNMLYYIGDIYEICLTETPLTEDEVTRKWNLINP